ncbi:MAG: flagellar hook-basal body protein [Candidatus Eremiobacteraeota bacterium]|nr:flagellar hook-basal body protein [Candidatus Eremiobacteraeota bacterium]MCL5055580.1 flagellar hook-basal body protein [Bacillota bacterium]
MYYYKGFEEATQGMIAMKAMQNILSNNLANANTPGFNQDDLQISSFSDAYATAMAHGGEGVQAGFVPVGGQLSGRVHLLMKSVTQFSQGQLKHTRQPFDLALDGKGFFTIETPNGTQYTRDGSFTINGQGFLATQDGGLVMGQHGPIQIKGGSFKVNQDGTVLVSGKPVDKLKITWVDEKDLQQVGTNGFKTINPMAWPSEKKPKVMQGYLEMSNVNAIKDMVSMLSVLRTYEADSKMLHGEDNMAKQVIQTSQVNF